MNSREQPNQVNSDSAQIYRQHSSTLTIPISEPLDTLIPLNIEIIDLMEEGHLAELGEYLEHKIYKKLLSKVTEHIVNALRRQKILNEPADKFNERKFAESLNNNIQSIVDKLDAWVNYNILRRQELVEFKKQILLKQEKKKQKIAQINELMEKIVEKQKKKRAQQSIDFFEEDRKINYVKFVQNPEIKTFHEKIKRVLAKRSNKTAVEFQKAEERVKAFRRRHQQELGSRFTNRFDQLKIF